MTSSRPILFAASLLASALPAVARADDEVPRTLVHLTSEEPAVLYRREPGTTAWTRACDAPCDVELPLRGAYKVAGNAVGTTDELSLSPAGARGVDVRVDTPSTGMMLLGGGAAAVGGSMLVLGLHGIAFPNGVVKDEHAMGGEATEALPVLAAGAVVTTLGILLFRSANGARVEQRPIAAR